MKTLAFTFLCFATTLPAQVLLQDIGTNVSTSSSTLLATPLVVGDRLFFGASVRNAGTEPWIVDKEGVRRVADVRAGRLGSSARFLASHEGIAYFGVTLAKGQELWRTDGSSLGTSFIAEGQVHGAVSVLGALYFLSDGGGMGAQLWRTDGTRPGTTLVASLGGSLGRTSTKLYAVGGKLVGILDRRTILASDGTAAGTRVFAGFPYVPTSESRESEPVVYRGAVYFVAGDAVSGVELARTDGTVAGTQIAHDLTPGVFGTNVAGLIVHAGRLYFHAAGELCATDGSAAGLVRLGSSGVFGVMLATEKLLFFTTRTQSSAALWSTGGVGSGATQVGTFVASASGSPYLAASSSTTILLFADDGTRGLEPYVSDGTAAGTTLLKDIFPGVTGSIGAGGYPIFAATVGPRFYFAAMERSLGNELWSTDGTPAGTRIAADLSPVLSVGGQHGPFTVMDREAFFAAYDDRFAIWRTDGTPAGTRRAVTGGTQRFQSIVALSALGRRLVFRAVDQATFRLGMYGSDGTEAGTVLLTPMHSGLSGLPQEMAVFRGRIFFEWSHPTYGSELWVTDGTPIGTRLFVDLVPGVSGSSPQGFTVVADRLFFFTNAYTANLTSLWISDGTAAGTHKVASFANPLQSIPIVEPQRGLVVFTSGGLWRSDGTAAGTFEIDTVSSLGPIAHGGRIYYPKDTPTGLQLWSSDGSVAGCRLVTQVGAHLRSALMTALAPGAGGVFFCAQEGNYLTLWASDGSTSGSRRLASVPREHGYLGYPLAAAANERSFLGIADPVLGMQLLVTDGTVSGTRRMTGYEPDSGPSVPVPKVRLGRKLLFLADDGVIGEELYALDLGSVGGAFADSFGESCGATLDAVGVPVIGNAAFRFAVSSAPANSSLLWLVAAARQDTPFAGCTLRLAAPLLAVPGATNALGAADLPIPLPVNPALVGVDAFAQAAVFGAAGVALSGGIHVLVGD